MFYLTIPSPRLLLLTLAASGCLWHSASANLVAEWKFSTGTSADLTSNVGDYSFEVYPGSSVTYNNGSLSLSPQSFLHASGVNSTAFPQLTQTATIYTRMKFDTLPTSAAFFFGLVDSTIPSDWFEMALTAWTPNGTKMGGYYSRTNGEASGEFSADLPAAGQYFSIAITMTAGVNAWGESDPTRTRLQTYVDGFLVNTIALEGEQIVDAQSLAIGRLKASTGGEFGSMTYSHIQVYDRVLSGAEIAAIPEPSSVAYALTASVLMVSAVVLRRRKLSRRTA